MVGAEAAILFNRSSIEKEPFDKILLGVFTLGLGLTAMVIESRYTPRDVLFLGLCLTFLLASMTIYAHKFDEFTEFGAMACACVVASVIGILMLLMTSYPPGYSIIVMAAMASWALYIVVDVQYLMAANNTHQLKEEQYILAALIVYIDIIFIFIDLCKTIAGKK
jgi:FtsH-binding integral membrane protein